MTASSVQQFYWLPAAARRYVRVVTLALSGTHELRVQGGASTQIALSASGRCPDEMQTETMALREGQLPEHQLPDASHCYGAGVARGLPFSTT